MDRSKVIINSLFPHILYDICTLKGAKLIHISTDCVFSGEKGGYNETNKHDATDVYGKSKSLGEPENACIIRTSIIGEEIRNKKSLLEWVKSQKGKTVTGFKNVYWNGVTCLQLAKYIKEIIDKNTLWTGVKHYTSTRDISFLNPLTGYPDPPIMHHDFISKADLIHYISEIYDLNIHIEYDTSIKKNMTLSSIYPLIETPTIGEQLEEMKEFNIYE